MNRLRQRLFVRALEDRTAPATFTVMNLNNSGADSLRDCISKANAAGGMDTVTFNSALSGTITLTSDIAINEQVNLAGTGKLTISGGGSTFIFNIAGVVNGTQVIISDLTLANGTIASNGGAIFGSDEMLVVNRCTFTGNKAGGVGGAVSLGGGGQFSAFDCVFTGNSASSVGGAIHISGAGARLELDGCTVSGNTANLGGGVYGRDTVFIDNCTISGNSATGGQGGGLATNTFSSTFTQYIRNSTVSGNSATADGGGVAVVHNAASGTFTVQNCTITANTAGSGSGGGIARVSGTATIAIESSIVSGNSNAKAPDISSTGTVNLKTSAVGSGTGFTMTNLGGNLAFGTNLKLGPLQNNGGPTLTHLPASDSPLVDVGSNPHTLPNDQRKAGFPRAIVVPDIGAVEFFNVVVRNTADTGFGSLRQAIVHANTKPGEDTITFDSSFDTGTKTIAFINGSPSLPVTDNTSIIGPGSARLTIQGFFGSIFDISNAPAGTAISLSGLTLTKGFSGNSNEGGAIFGDDQKLSIDSCQFIANNARTAGGAIALGKSGVLTVTRSSFTNNSVVASGVGAHGGAISAHQITATDCTFDNNSAESDGGAIGMLDQAGGSPLLLSLERCTLSNNSAKIFGGGVFISGSFAASTVTIRNSTLSGNTARTGSAIEVSSSSTTLQLHNSTITNNLSEANFGFPDGAVHYTSGALKIESSVIAQNQSFQFSPDMLFATATNIPSNQAFIGVFEKSNAVLLGAGNNAGSLTAVLDAKLGPLSDNGGMTKTHQPLLGSPVINAGNNSVGLAADQRGRVRIVGTSSDIGAVELQPDVLSLVPSAVTVADAHVGPDGFIVTATYNMAMNTAELPTVSFPVEVPAGSIVFSSSVWTNNTTIVTKFDVADLGTTLNNIDLKITGGLDAITAIAASSLTVVDAISLDTQNPFLTSIASSTPNGTYGVGQSINITLNLSEAATLTGTLNVTLDTGAVVAIAGPASGTTLSGTYTIAAGQNSPDLNVTTLALTGGSTLVDAATNSAVLTLPGLNLANTANIVVSTPAGVSGFVVNDGDAQRSRLTKVKVNFSALIDATTLAIPGGVTFTRTAGTPNGTVVDTSNGLIVFPASGMVSSVTLTFANVINAGVESGSLADGRLQLAIPSAGFTSVFNELNIFRFFGDADGDGTVAANDFIQFRLALGGSTAMFDFDGDGAVAASDFIQFRLRFGGSI